MHERYRQLNYDVALLELNRPIQMSYKARPVCLPQHGSRVLPATQCYITGWCCKTRVVGYGTYSVQALKPHSLGRNSAGPEVI